MNNEENLDTNEQNTLNTDTALKEKNQENNNKIIKISSIAISIFYFISIICAFIIIPQNNSKLKSQIKVDSSGKIPTSIVKKSSIGIVPIYGPIYQETGNSFMEKGSQQIVTRIKNFAKDKNIKGIVLDINSPGGSVGAVQEIYSTILKVKAETKKPFVAHFGEVSASGGYYIASACDKIIAKPGTITGSIGVIFSVGNVEGLFKKIGIKTDVIKSGKYKDIGSMVREMTKEEKEILQSMIDDSYNSFLDAVSQGRKIPKEKLKDIADGRVFTGNQALKVGLVDKIGDFQDAVDEAGIMAGLGKNPNITRTKYYSFSEILDMLDSKINFSLKLTDLKDDFPKLEYRWAGF